MLPIQCAETVYYRSSHGVRAFAGATDAGASVRAEHVGCAKSGLCCVLREDEVVHFAATKPDAIDRCNDGESDTSRDSCPGVASSVAGNSPDLRFLSAARVANAGPRFTAALGSLHVSHLIHGR